MKKRTKTWLIVTAGLALAGIATAHWVTSAPEYTTFTLNNNHTLLRVEYPTTWSVSDENVSLGTPGDTLALSPRRPTPLQAWLNSHLFHKATGQDQDGPYRGDLILLRWYKSPSDLETAASHLHLITSNPVNRSRCKLGNVLSSEETTFLAPIKHTIVHVAPMPDTPPQMLDLECVATASSKSITFRTVDDIVSRLDLIPIPPTARM